MARETYWLQMMLETQSGACMPQRRQLPGDNNRRDRLIYRMIELAGRRRYHRSNGAISSRRTFDVALVRFRQHPAAAGFLLVGKLRLGVGTRRGQLLVRFRLAICLSILCVLCHVGPTTSVQLGSCKRHWPGLPCACLKEFSMPIQICSACGTSYSDTSEPPSRCLICEDERQFVPRGGQVWTTPEKLADGHVNGWRQLEIGLFEIHTHPQFGIGQRALLLRTPQGNVLWDCISLLDAATEAL